MTVKPVLFLEVIQLGNKNDLDGHTSVKELIRNLYALTFLCLLCRLTSLARQLDKISDRPVSVSVIQPYFMTQSDAHACSAIR